MPDDKGSWHPIWNRGGPINEITWIGKDILAWLSALNIIFFDVNEKRESLRWPSDNSNGLCCLSGHPTLHVLAYAEKTHPNPAIRVLSYPSMKQVAKLMGGAKMEYLATAFTITDNFVSLASHPNYSLSLWAWRTGEKLASISTSIRDPEGQSIRVTPGKTILIAQLGRESGKLHIWDVNPAGKTAILHNHEVTLPDEAKAHHMDWSMDSGQPLLAIVDTLGHIYLTDQQGTQPKRIVLSQRCATCLDYEFPSVCWFRDGIVLKTTFCQIRFYKINDKGIWQKQWLVKSILRPRVLSVQCLKRDRLFYHTKEGSLMELEVAEGQDDPIVEKRMYQGGIFHFVDMVRPWGHHLVAMDDPSKVTLLDSYDGKQVAQLDLDLKAEVTQFSSHPDMPLLTVVTKNGSLAFMTFHDPEHPRCVAKFHLQRDRIDLIRYSQSGKNLVVGQRTTGICYFVSLTGQTAFQIIGRVETKCRMADVLFYDTEEHFKLLLLVVSSKRVPVGRHLVVHDWHQGQTSHIEPQNYLELPCAYQFLHYAPEGRFNVIATAYLSRQIHLLNIDDWKRVNLMEATASGHRVRRARLFTDRRWITSAAIDGSIALTNGKTRKIRTTMQTHHRTNLGVAKTIAQSSGNIVIGLGYDGSLVAMKFHSTNNSPQPKDSSNNCRIDFHDYEKLKKSIMTDYESLNAETMTMLWKNVDESSSMTDNIDKTWYELNREKLSFEESKKFLQRKSAVQSDLEKLKGKIAKLLNSNEDCCEIEKLPVDVFDLDKVARDVKLKYARDSREDAEHELEHNCSSMNKVNDWIKTTFWNSQTIHETSLLPIIDNDERSFLPTIGNEDGALLPIIGNEEITNYDERTLVASIDDMLRLSRFYWDAERLTMDEGPIVWPSKFYRTSKLTSSTIVQTKFDRTNEKKRMNEILNADDDVDDPDNDDDEIIDRLAIKGTTTHRFVDENDDLASQFERYEFSQLIRDHEIIISDTKKLQNYFNKLFRDLYETKERTMTQLFDRYDRIERINEELNVMFGSVMPKIAILPKWNSRELPENIVKVVDKEINVKPYITNEERELLKRQAEEAEKLRRILLADDFREKALGKMMDGVLEIRWEDVIKKDIEKPHCMTTKDPEDYNTDDIKAVRQYEKDVEDLTAERERYKRILESELTKIHGNISDTIDKFDAKFRELTITKMRVESSIAQLNLRDLRGWLGHILRMRLIREDDVTRRKILEKEKFSTKLDDESRVLDNLVNDYRNQHEALVLRERMVEKKFRNDFPSLRKIFVEMLEKEFRKRPRLGLKNATSRDFVELGKTVVNFDEKNKVSLLTHECLEYLRHLEILDVRPIGLPNTVEDHHWDHLTRARRHKIELEMNQRARLSEMNETEQTITVQNEKMEKCKMDVIELNEKLNKLKQRRMNFDDDIEIQLILNMGQIEVIPGGHRDDAKNSILIPRKNVNVVNEKITKVGNEKLTAMCRTVNFHRGIIFKQWEHECRKSSISELVEDLEMLKNILVTRQIRDLLSRQFHDRRDEKTVQQLQRELDVSRKNCEKRLEKWLKRLRELDEKISTTKRSNAMADVKIGKMNVDRWDLEWQRDLKGEANREIYRDRIMAVVMERSKIVRKLNETYNQVLTMETELELARMRIFPSLNYYKTLDEK